ncbi:MAG: polysulfide reductase NrfD [Magnetococcales bacterium]|nr:polysulfide reductase NrfD [Magnetococcales bacterium]
MFLTAMWGGWGYARQLRHGLTVTGMSDQITWGLYIGNFTFLVGLAAAAVVLLVMAHVFCHAGMDQVIVLGEAMALTAVGMALLFVVADLGQPWRIWHALPLLGWLNFPQSIMAWDIVVLVLYGVASLALGYRMLRGGDLSTVGRQPDHLAWPWVGIVLLLGLSIHTVTAFLLAANPARPLWHSAALAPRFLASAFASGAGLLIMLLLGLQRSKWLHCPAGVLPALTRVMVFSLLLELFFMGAEFFVLFYRPTGASAAAQWLFFAQNSFFTVWIRAAWTCMAVATLLLLAPGVRHRRPILFLAASLTCVGVWMEKGLGLIVPGFVPTPLGEVATYAPTWTEIQVTLGIWAVGAICLTLMIQGLARHQGTKARQSPRH